VRLTVERLGHHGEGIACGPEGPVYLPMTLPGEVVEAEVEGNRASEIRIVTPAPQRVATPCRHFRTCGGCAVQHASEAFVAEWKAGIVTRALAAHGLEAPITAAHVSPPSSRRRAVLAGRRTKSGVLVGFHARASEAIVEIADCHLLRPELMALLPALGEITRLGASRRDTLDLAVTLSDSGADLVVTGGRTPDPKLAAEIAGGPGAAFARISWNGELLSQNGAPMLRFGSATVPLPPGGFLQATAEGEATLRDAVLRAVGTAARIVDLFAGLGTFALPLAERADVHAVEGEAAMVAALEAGWRAAPGLHRLTAERRDLFRRPLLADELKPYDAAVIDPPRAGAEAQIRELARSPIPVLAHVSCNPATFARDARHLLDAGFRIDWVELVDQFRWSAHVELVARFARS
jgi:23S rRNA (uracil1939-C5)-methyltransferase